MLMHLFRDEDKALYVRQKIETIAKEHNDIMFEENDAVASYWFKDKDSEHSWSVLAKALEKCENQFLAMQIRDEDSRLFANLNELATVEPNLKGLK